MDLSPQRQRTYRAILDAAAREWARDPAVDLGRIATAAGVGRATIHRYFPDRKCLQTALISDSWAALHAAIVEAAPGDGPVPEAIDRIVSAMVHAGDRVLFLFSTTGGSASDADAPLADEVDRILISEIERGQRDGALDTTVPAQWLERMVWSIVYTGLHAVGDGLAARHGVDDLIRWTLRGAISAR
ncbi:TetR family transcriptional regulator [Actinomadura pelletieri DSM 43383]|uniref:TetR family transcriptional regulator n=1 Tax=Actinomadura pelletieri DSM 43383 TaxID=1120940 RepID=A0A495QT47_9ACTN|nr:TetR/AcrR family transcriptional regulator [Actinomadura pelletieri]RKS76608.1 TetR family transcriptional regulator [Actinomadura pelletieri DSM 43383]